MRGPQALRHRDVLDADGHPEQRRQRHAALQRGRRAPRLPQRGVAREGDDRVDLRIHGVDAVEQRLHDLERRRPVRAIELDQLHRGREREVLHAGRQSLLALPQRQAPCLRAMGVTPRLLAAALVALVLWSPLATGQPLPGSSPEATAALARGEWPAYAGTYASAKYSPLDQITRANVGTLRVAWRWESPDDGAAAEHAIDHRSELPPRVDPDHGGRRALHEHVAVAGGGHRRGHRHHEVGLRPGRPSPRPAREQRLAAPRRRLLARWRGRARDPPQRPRVHDRARREDRPAGADLRRRGNGRSQQGPRTAGRAPLALQPHVAAGDRPRRHRGRLLDHRLPAAPRHAAGRRAWLRRAHRQEAVDVPRRPGSRRGRSRDLGERVVEGDGRGQRVDVDVRGRGPRLRLPAVQHAGQRLLRRAAARRQPVRRGAGLRRRAHGQADLALPDHAARALGLRPARRAGAPRRHAERTAHQGRRAADQARLRVRLRPRLRRAALACRRSAGAAIDGRRREERAHAALPHEARCGRAPGRAGRGSERSHAGAQAGRDRDRPPVRPRPALHATERARHGRDARRHRRAELVRRRLGSRDRHLLRDDHPRALRAHASQAVAARERRSLRRTFHVPPGPAGTSALQAALGKRGGDRHGDRRPHVARARGQRPASPPSARSGPPDGSAGRFAASRW